jgi:hypothetical protein
LALAPPPLRVLKRACAIPPPPCPHHPATSPHCSPPPFDTANPKPSRCAQFWAFSPKPSPLARVYECRTPPPLPPHLPHPNTSSHRPPLPFDTAKPKSSHCARFWPFSPKPHPPARVCKCRTPPPLPPHPPHHNTSPHCPSLSFDTANPKPSRCARFWPFSPMAHSPACVCERTIPPLMPPHPPHPNTSLHHPPLLFDTANPKPSRCARFWPFSPKAPPPARVCKRMIPPPLPHHPPHPTTLHSCSTRQTRNRAAALSFGFLVFMLIFVFFFIIIIINIMVCQIYK